MEEELIELPQQMEEQPTEKVILKSLVPDVTTIDAMEEKVGYALNSQHFFERRALPWERELWKGGELENFTLDLKKVNRLYHISNVDDNAGDREYELLVRMVHNDDQYIFVELTAGCDYTGFDYQEGGGTICVSFDANYFFKNITMQLYNEDRIYQSLIEDGYRVDRDSVASRRQDIQILNKQISSALIPADEWKGICDLETGIHFVP